MADVIYKAAESVQELKQILQLQTANLPGAISKKELIEEGFVTVRHDFHLLKAMNDVCPHNIAVLDNKVIGYALSMHPDFGNSIEVLKPMFDEIDKVISKEISFIVMGQICIDKAYRRRGLFRGLYDFMKMNFENEFDWIITEVDQRNQRSVTAHMGIGFKLLSTYQASGVNWDLIYLPT